ncbi:MAG TPA: hypothetical protein PKB05_05405 [Oligoflexia bacterium]|nr:hypothetical protein [Oligoflexia bacterium]
MKKLFLIITLFLGAAHAGIYPVKSLKNLVSKNNIFEASLDFKANIWSFKQRIFGWICKNL